MEALGLGPSIGGSGYGVVDGSTCSTRLQRKAFLYSSSCQWQMHRRGLVCFASSTTNTCLPEEGKKLPKGLFQSLTLSPELQAFVGEQEMSRAEVTKQLWIHIRKNNLQDPDNKRRIICDDALRSLFEMHVVDMFEMNKLLSKHIGSPEKSSGRTKAPKGSSGLGRSTGLLKPHRMSEALQTFLGVSTNEFVRSEAVKLIWRYIKDNNLQDPANKRSIICDSKLRELFQCDSFHGFHLTRLLGPHFPKAPYISDIQ